MNSSETIRRRSSLVMLGAALGVGLFGCRGQQVAPKRPPDPQLAPLKLEPLSDLVVGAGLSWMIMAEPRAIFTAAALVPGLERLIPPSRLAVFERVTAIDIPALEQAIVADYDTSMLFVLDGVAAREAEERFRSRLVHDVVHKIYRADATWTHGRMARGSQRALSALWPDVVAIEGGGSLRSKVALLLAIGRLRKAPRALDLPDMQRVFEALGPAPVLALAPGPFVGEWAKALHGMLAVCTAVGASIRIGENGVLDASILLAGAWGDRASRASETLLAGWRDLVQSSLGRLLHLDEPVEGPRVDGTAEMVGLNVRLDGVKLLDGLYDAVAADVREILDLGGSETG